MLMIKIKMKKISTVKPAEKTPRRAMPFTLLDRTHLFPRYNSVVHIYRPKAAVDPGALRESLSKTLVHFYPMAGRCRLDCRGTIEIDCNDEGVPFLEAETASAIEDLRDLAPSPEMSVLLPSIDLTAQHISAYPMMAVQVTYFTCGGVSIGVRVEHHSVDGSSTFHLIKSWSEISRGMDISTPPFLDRTSLLRPRDPPQPKFDHPEYSQYGSPNQVSHENSNNVKVSVFGLSQAQLRHMKARAKQTNGLANTSTTAGTNFSTFEVLAGHIWRCVCKARRVGSEEETRLMFPVDARFGRFDPKLPPGFFGNAFFRAVPASRAGDLESKPLWYAASKIHEALVRMDSEYLRSAIDHRALLPADLSAAEVGPHLFYSPNFQISSWAKMGLNDADFGWGPPIYTGPGSIKYEKAYIFPSDHNGGLSVAIALRAELMEIFEKLFYECEGKETDRDSFLAKL